MKKKTKKNETIQIFVAKVNYNYRDPESCTKIFEEQICSNHSDVQAIYFKTKRFLTFLQRN